MLSISMLWNDDDEYKPADDEYNDADEDEYKYEDEFGPVGCGRPLRGAGHQRHTNTHNLHGRLSGNPLR